MVLQSKKWYNKEISGRYMGQWIHRNQSNFTTKTAAAETQDDVDDRGRVREKWRLVNLTRMAIEMSNVD